jgi:hypothetical protein
MKNRVFINIKRNGRLNVFFPMECRNCRESDDKKTKLNTLKGTQNLILDYQKK